MTGRPLTGTTTDRRGAPTNQRGGPPLPDGPASNPPPQGTPVSIVAFAATNSQDHSCLVYDPAFAPPGKAVFPVLKKDFEQAPNAIVSACPKTNIRATCDMRSVFQDLRYYYLDGDEHYAIVMQTGCVNLGGTWTWTVAPSAAPKMTPDTGAPFFACDIADTLHTCTNYEPPPGGFPPMVPPDYAQRLAADERKDCDSYAKGAAVPRCSTAGVTARCDLNGGLLLTVKYYYTSDSAQLQSAQVLCLGTGGKWMVP